MREAGRKLAAAEVKLATGTRRAQPAYAEALVAWGEAGGYEEEIRFDTASVAALGLPWDEEHAKLRALMLSYKQKASYNSDMASRYQAAQTRLRTFEAAGPPPKTSGSGYAWPAAARPSGRWSASNWSSSA